MLAARACALNCQRTSGQLGALILFRLFGGSGPCLQKRAMEICQRPVSSVRGGVLFLSRGSVLMSPPRSDSGDGRDTLPALDPAQTRPTSVRAHALVLLALARLMTSTTSRHPQFARARAACPCIMSCHTPPGGPQDVGGVLGEPTRLAPQREPLCSASVFRGPAP